MATQDEAIALPGCGASTITNTGASTIPAVDDPFNTVYAFGGTFSRHVWYSLTNTTSVPAYGRFILVNNGSADVDVAAAIYTDSPAANPLQNARTYTADSSDDISKWRIPLIVGDSIPLGQVLEPGETLWLEVAGDDTEGDGLGWNGSLTLQWKLLSAVTYDTLGEYFDDTRIPHANYVATLTTVPDSDPQSYCKLGDLHFAVFQGAIYDSGQVLVWTEGGSATSYTFFDYTHYGFANPGSDGKVGPSHPLLRTDGDNLWLIIYVRSEGAIQCRPGNCDPPIPFHTTLGWSPAVYVWNGAGFTNLGTGGGDTFKVFDYEQAVGQLTAAASDAEPGVVHVVWSEAGATQIYLCEDEAGFTNGGCELRSYAQRVVYARWSTSGIEVSNYEMFGDHGHVPDDTDDYVSGAQFITNAFGSPVFFYSKPTAFNPEFAGSSGIVTYGSVIDMYSLDSSGTPTLQQSIDISTIPGFSGETLWGDFGNRISGTQQHQPVYQGVETIFFGTGLTVSPDVAIILSVPADGSGPITFFSGAINIPDESYTDPDNVWLSFPGNGGKLRGFPIDCPDPPVEPSYHLALGDTDPCISLSGGLADRGMEFFYDSGSDSYYTLGWNCSSDASLNAFAPLKVPILRDFLACTVGTCAYSSGLHVWQVA